LPPFYQEKQSNNQWLKSALKYVASNRSIPTPRIRSDSKRRTSMGRTIPFFRPGWGRIVFPIRVEKVGFVIATVEGSFVKYFTKRETSKAKKTGFSQKKYWETGDKRGAESCLSRGRIHQSRDPSINTSAVKSSRQKVDQPQNPKLKHN
jgi:hypothetical protein